MSLVETLHAERKARLARLGSIPSIPVSNYEPVKSRDWIKPHAPNYYWSHMWFWDLVNPKPAQFTGYRPPVHKIVEVVSRHYGISVTDIVSQRRTADVVLPRQVSMYLARHHTTLSLPQIGRVFGKRDHTTILYAVKRIKFYMERSPEMRATIGELMQEMGRT